MTAARPRVDLISDTATRPGAAMRRAMAEAEVGDEQRGEDPTVNALNARVAALLGQEAAIFLPSGTMCNQIALAVHCGPGDEIIAAANSHIVSSEGAGAAVFSGSVIRGIDVADGIYTASQLRAARREPRVKSPRSRLAVIEQTSNRGGGAIWPVQQVEAVADAARELGLALHMDGARLMNAAVASGISAARYASRCDSVWLDLSKGLGCPVGGVLAGSRGFIREAEAWKHRFGGAMRQAGILAAAGLYALDHNVDRLAEDHRNAQVFAAGLAELPGIRLLSPRIDTNLVFFDVSQTGLAAGEIARRLAAAGVRIGAENEQVMRAVFHLDVDAAGTEAALQAMRHALRPAGIRK